MYNPAFAKSVEGVTPHVIMLAFFLWNLLCWVLHGIFSSLGNSILNINDIKEQNTIGQTRSLCSSESRRDLLYAAL